MNQWNMSKWALSAMSVAVLTCVTIGCKGDGQQGGPTQAQVMDARAPIASFRSQLDLIRPRIDSTIDSAINMLANPSNDPKGSIDTFNRNLGWLKEDQESIRREVDKLQEVGYEQYFLGSNRTTDITSDAAVTSAREKYGFVGDYMVELRDTGRQTMAQLDKIASAVNANPTPAGISSQSNAISQLAQDKIELNSLINLLTSSIDKMPRAK